MGQSLAGQKKYDEAEPLLLSGLQGLEQSKATIAAFSLHFIEEARESLAEVYRVRGKTGKAAELKAKRSAKQP